MADINKAMDTLSEMLSTEEGKKNLTDMMNTFTGGSSDGNNTSVTESSTGNSVLNGINMDTMMKIKNAMDEFQSNNDNRSNLLLAIKPYLNATRLGRIDETIGLLKLAKLPNVIKGFRK